MNKSRLAIIIMLVLALAPACTPPPGNPPQAQPVSSNPPPITSSPTLPAATNTAFPTATPTITPTSTHTATPTSTLTPTETATPAPTPLGGGSGQIIYSYSIDNPAVKTGPFGTPRQLSSHVFSIMSDGSKNFEFLSAEMPETVSFMGWSPDGSKIFYSKNSMNYYGTPAPSERTYDPSKPRKIHTRTSICYNTESSNFQEENCFLNSDNQSVIMGYSMAPDGNHYLIKTGAYVHDYWIPYFIGSLGSQRQIRISDTGASARWSPDGKKIVFYKWDGKKWRMNLYEVDKGKSTFLKPEGSGGLSWSPDGNRIAYIKNVKKNQTEIFILDLETLEEEQVTFLENQVGPPTWSPDGKKISFRSAQAKQIVVTDLETKKYVIYGKKVSGYTWSPDNTYIAYCADPDGDSKYALFMVDASTKEITTLIDNIPTDCYLMWKP